MSVRETNDLISDQPLYQQVINLFQDKITSGEWPVHTKLRDEIALSSELGISRGTLRRAIRELIRQGVLVQMKGRGTFVVSNTIEQPLATRLVSFAEAMKEQGLDFTTNVIRCKREIAGERVRALLELAATDEVWRIERVRSVDGRAVIYLENFVPTSHLPDLSTEALKATALFQLIESRTGHRLDWGRRYFRAIAATDSVALRLGVPPNHPLLFLEQIVYSTRSQPIECSNVWINSSRFDVVAILNR